MKDNAVAEKLLVYTVPEAGALVGLTRNAAYEAVKRGEIPIIRFGKLIRVPKLAWHKKLEEKRPNRRWRIIPRSMKKRTSEKCSTIEDDSEQNREISDAGPRRT